MGCDADLEQNLTVKTRLGEVKLDLCEQGLTGYPLSWRECALHRNIPCLTPLSPALSPAWRARPQPESDPCCASACRSTSSTQKKWRMGFGKRRPNILQVPLGDLKSSRCLCRSGSSISCSVCVNCLQKSSGSNSNLRFSVYKHK